jgi:hypothetical protein
MISVCGARYVRTHVVDINPRFGTIHLDVCLVAIPCDSTDMGDDVYSICEFDDADAVVSVLVLGELGMLYRLAKSVNLVDFFLAVWTAGRNSCEPACGVNLVYTDIGEQAPRSRRKSDKEP